MPDAQTLFLHIGRGKTGTTALQHYLADHAGALLDRGIHYPAASGGADRIGHDTFGKAFITERPFYMTPPKDIDLVLETLARELRASQAPRILLCSEQLELADPVWVRAYLDGIDKQFRYRILFFLRSQDELVESEYNQLVKMRRLTQTLQDFADSGFNGDFHATATAWETVFGPGSLSCHIYDARRPRVLAQVLGALGVGDAPRDQPGPSAVNQSPTFQALAAMRLLNAIEINNRKAVYDQITRGFADGGIPALYFDSASAARFRGRFAASNRQLSKRFLNAETEDLGGRRHTNAERDEIRQKITALCLSQV